MHSCEETNHSKHMMMKIIDHQIFFILKKVLII